MKSERPRASLRTLGEDQGPGRPAHRHPRQLPPERPSPEAPARRSTSCSTTLLSGAMRWDIRDPARRFADRFVLGAGHTIPLVYSTLAVLNEALRIKHRQTGDDRYRIRDAEHRALHWEDLTGFRRCGGLSGHAEMIGKSLFLKFNTGPSGHGCPASAGIALALKRAGAEGVKVFVLEGEGGLTPGATHETANSAWGLSLDNLVFLVDWNNFGIDDHPISGSVYGTPVDWFGSHGWRVRRHRAGGELGSDHPRADGDAAGRQSGEGADRGVGEDPQGTGLPQVRRRLPRQPARAEQRGVLGDQAPVRRAVRGQLRELRRRCSCRREGPAGGVPAESPGGDRRAAPGPGARGLPGGPVGGARGERAQTRCPRSASARSGNPFVDPQAAATRGPIRWSSSRGRRRSGPTGKPWGDGAPGSTPWGRRSTASPCSWRAPPTSPAPRTSPVSARPSAISRGTAGTSATGAPRGRCCPRRSPSSPTRASWPDWRR